MMAHIRLNIGSIRASLETNGIVHHPPSSWVLLTFLELRAGGKVFAEVLLFIEFVRDGRQKLCTFARRVLRVMVKTYMF